MELSDVITIQMLLFEMIENELDNVKNKLMYNHPKYVYNDGELNNLKYIINLENTGTDHNSFHVKIDIKQGNGFIAIDHYYFDNTSFIYDCIDEIDNNLLEELLPILQKRVRRMINHYITAFNDYHY